MEKPQITKSKVVRLYDYHLSEIPEELKHWRVTDGEIQEKLEVMAARHIIFSPVEDVETGDSVRCVCIEGTSLKERVTVLLYPGRNLALQAETDVLGRKRGEAFHTTVGDTNLCLRVEEILRRCPPPTVTDELVRMEHIQGVDSIESYARWYREQNESSRQRGNCWKITAFWSREIAKKSEFAIDKAERDEYIHFWGRWQYDAQIQSGVDPRIPDEGTELLTEEQAIEKYAQEIYIGTFSMILAKRSLEDQKGIVFEEGDDVRRYEKLLAEYHITEEEYFKGLGLEFNEENKRDILADMRDQVLDDKLNSILTKEAMTYMEV